MYLIQCKGGNKMKIIKEMSCTYKEFLDFLVNNLSDLYKEYDVEYIFVGSENEDDFINSETFLIGIEE